MLKANKNRLFEQIFTIYNRNLLKRRFHSFNISGLENLKLQSGKSLIIYANHSSWWDGLLIFEICRRASIDFYVMMEKKQLQDLPLFRRLGAFSVVRENPRKAIESINYAVNLLSGNSSKTLLIFPQGEIQPNDLRPLKFFNGLTRIIEKSNNCSVVPIAIRLEFGGEYKPEIFIKIGPVKNFPDKNSVDYKALTPTLSQNLTELLDELNFEINNKQTDNFINIFNKS